LGYIFFENFATSFVQGMTLSNFLFKYGPFDESNESTKCTVYNALYSIQNYVHGYLRIILMFFHAKAFFTIIIFYIITI